MTFDPTPQILQVFSGSSGSNYLTQIQNPQFKEILSSISLPQYSNREIQQYSTGSSNKTHQLISAALKNLSFSFQFDPNLISNLLSLFARNGLKRGIETEIASKVVLLLVLSLTLTENENTKVSDYSKLIKLICEASLKEPAKNIKSALNISVLFVAELFVQRATSSKISQIENFEILLESEFSEVLDSVKQALQKINIDKIDNFCLFLLKKASPAKGSEIPLHAKVAINFISGVAKGPRAVFSSEAARQIVMLASRPLLAFDAEALDFFVALSRFTEKSVSEQVVDMIADSLNVQLLTAAATGDTLVDGFIQIPKEEIIKTRETDTNNDIKYDVKSKNKTETLNESGNNDSGNTENESDIVTDFLNSNETTGESYDGINLNDDYYLNYEKNNISLNDNLEYMTSHYNINNLNENDVDDNQENESEIMNDVIAENESEVNLVKIIPPRINSQSSISNNKSRTNQSFEKRVPKIGERKPIPVKLNLSSYNLKKDINLCGNKHLYHISPRLSLKDIRNPNNSPNNTQRFDEIFDKVKQPLSPRASQNYTFNYDYFHQKNIGHDRRNNVKDHRQGDFRSNVTKREVIEKCIFKFPHKETFCSGFDPTPHINKFDDDWSCIVTPDVLSSIKKLVHAFRGNDILIKRLLESAGKCATKSRSQLASQAALVALLLEAKEAGCSVSEASAAIDIKQIFNPDFIAATGTPANCLRSRTVSLAVEDCDLLFVSLLQLSSKHPHIFLEVISTLTAIHQRLVVLVVEKCNSTLIPLAQAAASMQKISDEQTDEHPLEVVDKARGAFLVLAKMIGESDEAQKTVFSCSPFTRVILSFVFDEKTREYTLSVIENALKECGDLPVLSLELADIIKYCFYNFSEKSTLLALFVVQTVNRAAQLKTETLKNFIVFSNALFEMMNKLFQSESCRLLFQEIMIFISLFSPYAKKFVVRHKDSIKNAANKLYENEENPRFLYVSLIKIAIDEKKCLIRHPILLPLIFELYRGNELFDLLDELLNNPINIAWCNVVCLDNNLLLALDENKEDKQKIEKLFTKIALVSISSSSLFSYLRLLSPRNGKIPTNAPYFLSYLDQLLVASLKAQNESWPLEPRKILHQATINVPKSEFSFTGWVFVNTMMPTYYPCIFKILNDKNKIVCEVFFRMKKLFISCDNKRKRPSVQLDFTFPSDEWSFISLNFKREENDTFIELYANCKKVASVRVQESLFSFLNEEQLSFIFGGALDDVSVETNFPCKLGPFAILDDFTVNNMKVMYNDDQRFFGRNCNSTLLLKYQPYAFGPRHQQRTLASSLVLKMRIEALIPLFEILSLPLETHDGEIHEEEGNIQKDKSLIDLVFSIFTHAFHFGSTIEDSFHNSNGFGIISHILLQPKSAPLINSSLYFSFYKLYTGLMTEDLKIDLFNTILLNFHLWSSTLRSETVIIVDHWLNTLVPKHLKHVIQNNTFSSLLNMTILTFHDEEDLKFIHPNTNNYEYACQYCLKSKDSCNNERYNTEDLKIPENNDFKAETSETKTIMDIMFQILLVISYEIFTFDDYLLLVSYLSKTNSPTLNNNIMNLLKQMILVHPESLQTVFANETALSRLNAVFSSTESVGAVAATLEIIVFLHKAQMISTISLQDHLDAVVSHIPVPLFCKELFDRIVGLMAQATPELFSLCCWIAAVIGDKCNREVILENIQPSEKIVIPLWALAPALLAARSDLKYGTKIVNFLADCCNCINNSAEQLQTIFFSISIVCSSVNVNPAPLQNAFLKHILEIYIKKKEQHINDILLKLISNYLFYRDLRYYSMPKFFEGTPFSGWEKDLATKEKRRTSDKDILQMQIYSTDVSRLQFKALSDFSSKILNACKTKIGAIGYFGLRFEKQPFKWADREIALLLLKYMVNYQKNESQLRLQYLLLYFLISCAKNTPIIEYIRTIDNPTMSVPIKNIDAFQQVVDLVCFQLDKLNVKDIHLLNCKSQNFRVNGQSYFQYLTVTCDSGSAYDDLLKEVLNTRKKVNDLFTGILKIPTDRHQGFFKVSQKKTFIEYANSLYRQRFIYKSLFESLTIDNAPFASMISPNSKHYLRDSTLIGQLIPLQTKTNHHFCDHKEAAQVRDKITQNGEIINRNILKLISDEEKNCDMISIKRIEPAIIEFQNRELKILKLRNYKLIRISLADLKWVTRVTELHRHVALEIITVFGDSYFLSFSTKEIRDKIFEKLRLYGKSFEPLTDKWLAGNISNFDYLLSLNYAAGRSFNNPAQYPIFPFVLADYDSEKLDLGAEDTFRDLSKPSGLLGEEKANSLRLQMANLKKLGEKPYLFSAAPSCPLSLYLMLIRLEPFTSLHIEMHGGRFDDKKRLFNSIPELYSNIRDDANDYRELCPEFYFCPEFLTNKDRFDIGIDDVILPKWASSPEEFIYMHRKALESRKVRAKLHEWIDLLFGVLQKSENNIYEPRLYEDAWSSSNSPESDESLKSSKLCLGQIPLQLFKKNHQPFVSKTQPLARLEIRQAEVKVGTGLVFATAFSATSRTVKLLFVDEKFARRTISFDTVTLESTELRFEKAFQDNNSPRSQASNNNNINANTTLYNNNQNNNSQEMRANQISSQISNFNSNICSNFDSLNTISPVNINRNNNRNVNINNLNLNLNAKSDRKIFPAFSSSMLVICSNQNSFLLNENGEYFTFPKKYILSASDSQSLVNVCNDSLVYLFRKNELKLPRRRLHYFGETAISCVAVSSKLGLIVIAAKDSTITYLSLYHSSMKLATLPDKLIARKIVFCKAIGFMVVYASIGQKHELISLTINSDLIARKALPSELVAIESFYTATRGIDHLIFVDRDNKVHACEAYTLDQRRLITELPSRPILFKFKSNLRAIISITYSGDMTIIPSDRAAAEDF
ncbi:hypothetical protein TRFO_01810 [Tritrichomonas foetus]|uniref:BEACH domain-containing protein n=1 Tax=Tritrichomonas foetus TaxID=1144522 RepID=A0A1J4JML0_9EUKA|nr:hypothetical protein TRFO_01810 [Tritrichomonas foetus]|eukprot:OHS98771.1 hypothetical protein TRFO_01810 [Tritrichomonas foetus]